MFEFLGVAMICASMADLASTEYALRQPGIAEGNFLYGGSQTAFRIAKPAITVGLWYGTKRLHENHPLAAILFRAGITAGYTYVATRNLQLAFEVRF